MFNKKLTRQLSNVDHRVSALEEHQRLKYWELRHDLDLLAAALGMEKRVTSKQEYIRKGEPEKP